MDTDPFRAVRAFEADLCRYTGARYAVAVNSCTMALLLCCAYQRQRLGYAPVLSIPKRTYVGVAMSIFNARCGLAFRDEEWVGAYELKVDAEIYNPRQIWIWDAARRFTRDMCRNSRGQEFSDNTFQCVSFHVSKILGHSQGGAILHNSEEADTWLRRARFDGRAEGVPPAEDVFDMIGWHCYMSPDVATALQWKLSTLPDVNPDLPNSNYPDLSTAPIFRY